jgi:ADP-heptose:LPS heptosyltransferase
MLHWGGVGDALMMTAAIHEFKRQNPHVRIVCHHRWEAGRLWEHNADIDEVRIYDPFQNPPPPEVVDFGVCQTGEGTVRNVYALLGLECGEWEDRKFYYYVQEDERCAAISRLSAENLKNGWIVGIQQHGGFTAKNWKRTRALVNLLLKRGAWVLTFGQEKERCLSMPKHPQLINLERKLSLREAIAVVSLCDAFVGFDSGLTYAAAAVETPIVALYGPHDARGLIADANVPNMSVFRKRTPQDCEQRFGHSCMVAGNWGSSCPLRAGCGADCIDEIRATEVLAELEKLPRWNVPLEDRKR